MAVTHARSSEMKVPKRSEAKVSSVMRLGPHDTRRSQEIGSTIRRLAR
jgi:hypothetical protein